MNSIPPPPVRSPRALTPRWGLLTLCLSLVLFTLPALGSGFRVSPLRVNTDPGERDATVTVQNLLQRKQTMQVRMFDWSQNEGRDLRTPSSNWIVSPPIFSLNAGESQLIRLRYRGPLSKAGQQAFRMYVDNVPDKTSNQASGVGFGFRVGIPVFVSALVPQPPAWELRWGQHDGSGGQLSIRNTGGIATRVHGVEVHPDRNSATPSSQAPLKPSTGGGWLLPGSTLTWVIPGAIGPTLPSLKVLTERITIETNRGRWLAPGALWID